MLRRLLLSAALGSALLAPAADAAEHVPGEVVVRYEEQDGGLARTEVVSTPPARACARRSPACATSAAC